MKNPSQQAWVLGSAGSGVRSQEDKQRKRPRWLQVVLAAQLSGYGQQGCHGLQVQVQVQIACSHGRLLDAWRYNNRSHMQDGKGPSPVVVGGRQEEVR